MTKSGTSCQLPPCLDTLLLCALFRPAGTGASRLPCLYHSCHHKSTGISGAHFSIRTQVLMPTSHELCPTEPPLVQCYLVKVSQNYMERLTRRADSEQGFATWLHEQM